MKKRICRIVLILVTLFICACGTEDKVHNENELEMPPPTITQAVEATTVPTTTLELTEDQMAEAYINALDTIDWTDLAGYVNEEESIRNSNMLNYGYLIYDNQGQIYYLNKNDETIYVSGIKGENKQIVCEDNNIFGWLQLKKGWLYYSDTETRMFRIYLETGKIEQISKEYSGVFFIDDEKIYFEDREMGFCVMDLDGNNKEMIVDSRKYLDIFTTGDEYWIGKIYGGSVQIWRKNYLVKLREEKIELLKQRGNYPLLAGKYLSVVSDETETRHIWNLETKQDIDLNVDTEKAVVSDGTDFYYLSKTYYGDNVFTKEGAYCIISKWDGTSAEEIIKVEGNAFQLYHMFLTPDMLYYQPDVMVDGRQVAQLWYYDLKTGETGQIY